MYIKVEGDEGDTLEANVTEFVPLSYSDLAEIQDKKNSNKKLRIVANSDEHTRNDQKNTEQSKLSFNVNFPHQVSIIALVDGGWLPPPFVMSKLFIVDHNVVTVFKKINNGSQRLDHVASEWWMRFLTDKNVVVNPVLYALEGCKRKAPTFSEFIRYFDEAVVEIKKAVPGVSVINYQGIHYKAAYSIIKELGDNLTKEARFLLDVMPLIRNRVATKRLAEVRNQIITIAKDHDACQSLAVLVVLSCLYESDKENSIPVARKILKRKRPGPYAIEDAYNALNDLRALQLAISARGVSNEKFSFCTHDVGLALLWCGLSPSLSDYVGSNVTIDFKFSKHIFPRLPADSVEELKSELSLQ